MEVVWCEGYLALLSELGRFTGMVEAEQGGPAELHHSTWSRSTHREKSEAGDGTSLEGQRLPGSCASNPDSPAVNTHSLCVGTDELCASSVRERERARESEKEREMCSTDIYRAQKSVSKPFNRNWGQTLSDQSPPPPLSLTPLSPLLSPPTNLCSNRGGK